MSDVPVGYKQTDVGVIPEDWKVEPLENYTSFISYGFTNPMPTSMDGVYMITARDINSGRILLENARCTTYEAFNKLLTPKSRPKKQDLLLTKDGTLGRLAIVDDDLICINQSVAIIRPNNKINPLFFKLLLESPPYQSKMLDDAGGSTIKHIYITIVSRMLLGVPPTLTEQTAIATALSDVDALLNQLDKLIAKKRDIKQATMQQLLTGKKRLAGFGDGKGYKQTEIGEIPEDWGICPFIEIVEKYLDYRGRTPKKLGMDWGNGDILALSANNVEMGQINPEKEAYQASEELYKKWMQNGHCEQGDVLMTMEAPLGNIAQIPDNKKYILSQRVLLIRPKKFISKSFFTH